MELASRTIKPPTQPKGPFVIARLNPNRKGRAMLFYDREDDDIYWTALLPKAAAFDSLAMAKPVSVDIGGWVMPLTLAQCLPGLKA